MSTSDGASGKSTSGGTSKPLKHALGFTRKGSEQYSEVHEEFLAPQDPKYINYKSLRSVLQEVTQERPILITICPREPLYAPRFKAVDAWREERGLKLSLLLDLELESDGLENENMEDNEYIQASLAERLWMFDGLEDTEVHSPPVVTEGNVAVPSLDGGKVTSELEKHEASGTK